MKIQAEEKKTYDKKFNVIDVINKTYGESTQYDLNDTLIYLTNTINKTKQENKRLVKQHFSKFVQCRVVLEEIWVDIKRKGYDTEFTTDLEENIKIIEQKFNEITNTVIDDSRNEINRERKDYYLKKYDILFNIKNKLNEYKNNLERFAEIYQKAKVQYNEVKNSKYVENIWKSIHDERYDFLEEVYKQIQKPENSFYEALYYFNLYFKVCEKKTDRKIMNTLLVNFKENTTKSVENEYLDRENFVEEVMELYLKLIQHVDQDIQVEGTNHFFVSINKAFYKAPLLFKKIWLGKLINLCRKINVSDVVFSLFTGLLKKLKIGIIDAELECKEKITIKNFNEKVLDLKKKYDVFIDIASKEEEKYLRNKIVEIIEKYFNQVKMKKISDLENSIKIAYELKPILGRNGSESVKYLYRVINEQMEKHIEAVGDSIIKKIKKYKSDTFILTEIIKTMKDMPLEYVRVIKKIEPSLEEYPVVLHYISGILEKKPQHLSNAEKLRIREIDYQFGFLLNNTALNK